MESKHLLDSVLTDQQEELVDLINKFLDFVDELHMKDIITEETYDQLTHYKKNFLKDISK